MLPEAEEKEEQEALMIKKVGHQVETGTPAVGTARHRCGRRPYCWLSSTSRLFSWWCLVAAIAAFVTVAALLRNAGSFFAATEDLVTKAAVDTETSLPPWHVNSTAAASHTLGYLRFDAPSVDPDDLLVWFLTRSGGNAPLFIEGWTRVAECFKSDDRQARCFTVSDDCAVYSDDDDDGRYCLQFIDGLEGNDLLTVVYIRRADPNTPTYTIALPKARRAKIGIMTAVRGADLLAGTTATTAENLDPLDIVVRDVALTSCDHDKRSIFPSVEGGRAGDILLLYMASDDMWPADDFIAPNTTSSLLFFPAADKTAALYGKQLTVDGPTGTLVTRGPGGTSDNDNPADCKDQLLAIALRGR